NCAGRPRRPGIAGSVIRPADHVRSAPPAAAGHARQSVACLPAGRPARLPHSPHAGCAAAQDRRPAPVALRNQANAGGRYPAPVAAAVHRPRASPSSTTRKRRRAVDEMEFMLRVVFAQTRFRFSLLSLAWEGAEGGWRDFKSAAGCIGRTLPHPSSICGREGKNSLTDAAFFFLPPFTGEAAEGGWGQTGSACFRRWQEWSRWHHATTTFAYLPGRSVLHIAHCFQPQHRRRWIGRVPAVA